MWTPIITRQLPCAIIAAKIVHMGEKIDVTWPIEPHTEAKHAILKCYLGAWFPILAKTPRRLLYVDGFAGPGEYEGGEDGSPIVALQVARDHLLKHKFERSGMELVFIFIEKDEARFENLRRKLAQPQQGLPSNFKVQIINDTFENAVGKALGEIEEQNKRLAPSFVFIDPFGPTGFPMTLIGRLANQPRSEALINFNYQALNQWFLQDELKHKHVDELYGSDRWRLALNISDSRERETFLRETYQDTLRDFGWKVRSFQMINKHNQTQYYLFFGTANSLGMLAMKSAMWSTSPIGEFKYSDLSNPQQACLFEGTYNEEYSRDLALELHQKYRNQTVAKGVLLNDDVAWHPICIGRHLTRALAMLEYESKPPEVVSVQLPDNRKRRKGTYPDDCTIKFAP